MPSVGRILHAQHAARRAVHELHAAVLVDDDDAFDHAAEDRLHPRLVRREVGGAAADFTDRFVQHAGDRPDLVVAVVARRARQVAGRIALGHGGNRAHAAAEQDGNAPAESKRRDDAGPGRDQRDAPDGRELIAHLHERHGEPHVGERLEVRVANRHRRVQHVRRQCGAVAAGDAESLLRGLEDLRTPAVILEGPERLAVQVRIAHHGSVAGDEGHARRNQRRQRVGFVVELALGRGLAVRQRFGGEPRFVHQRSLDLFFERPADRPRHQRRRHRERYGRGGGRGDEDAGAERHGRSTSL